MSDGQKDNEPVLTSGEFMLKFTDVLVTNKRKTLEAFITNI